jgi:hypothetical protein
VNRFRKDPETEAVENLPFLAVNIPDLVPEDKLVFPMRIIDHLIIEALGTRIEDHPGIHCERYIFPV